MIKCKTGTEAGLASSFAICGGLHCTRYDFRFQTKWNPVIALLSSSYQRGLPFVDFRKHQEGKCETCGFFSKHGRGSSAPAPRYYEVEKAERTNTNEMFSHYADGRHVSCEIACFQHKVDFMREINRLVDQGQRNLKLVEMVRLDRHCEAWYPYRPGFSPKEHYEELQMQRLEADRQKLALQLSEISQRARTIVSA